MPIFTHDLQHPPTRLRWHPNENDAIMMLSLIGGDSQAHTATSINFNKVNEAIIIWAGASLL